MFWALLAILLSGGTMLMAIVGSSVGTIYAKPSGDPRSSVTEFFDALVTGDYETAYSLMDDYSDLGLDTQPESEAGQLINQALKESYHYELVGDCQVNLIQASQRVWVESLPYLQGVDSSWDKTADDFEVTVQYDAQQVSDAMYAYLGIDVTGNPDTWVGDTVWDEAGYVDTIQICGQSVSGTDMRSALSLRSACFAIAWQDGEFTVTTRGYGHGVGMSQEGARAMAAGGASWKEILSYYFPGTQLGSTDDLA